MGYLGRRIGKAQDQGDSNPAGADGAVGGGILDLFENGYFERQGGIYNAPGIAPAPVGLTATGGVISDYTDPSPGAIYRAHIFTSSGTFTVTDTGDYGSAVEYLCIAGGGGGAVGGDYSSYQAGGGGGGAGGLLVSPGSFPATVPSSQNQGTGMSISAGPTAYTITIGAGGAGGNSAPGLSSKGGKPGGNSTISGPDITTITSNGGGGGAGNNSIATAGGSGGGGEGAYSPAPLSAAKAGSSYPGPTQQGFPGGEGSTNGGSYPSPGVRHGGGGGGAGAAGVPGADSEPGVTEGDGGIGLQIKIAGAPPLTQPMGTPGPNPGGGYFAQGGHAGAYNNASNGTITQPAGGGGGDGGAGGTSVGGGVGNATESTGSGGGGSNATGSGYGYNAGSGASGIVILRYQIGSIDSLKASGGNVSFVGSKTVHTFTSSGTFTANEALTVDYLLVGGGGGASGNNGSGGGGGGIVAATGAPLPTGPHSITVGSGGAHGTSATTNQLNAPGGDSILDSNSVSFTLTAGGGGRGSHYPNANGGDGRTSAGLSGGTSLAIGGSGGGGGHPGGASAGSGGGAAGADSNTNGYDGGSGSPQGGNGPATLGGGGGAGEQGEAGGPSQPGNGGDGYQNNILGTNYYWGGGGGGSVSNDPSAGAGGKGGGGGGARGNQPGGPGPAPAGPELFAGGAGVNSRNGNAGDGGRNTGGGAGGAGYGMNGTAVTPTTGRGGKGGSGIVIIAYPT